jgi:hypothetical protein
LEQSTTLVCSILSTTRYLVVLNSAAHLPARLRSSAVALTLSYQLLNDIEIVSVCSRHTRHFVRGTMLALSLIGHRQLHILTTAIIGFQPRKCSHIVPSALFGGAVSGRLDREDEWGPQSLPSLGRASHSQSRRCCGLWCRQSTVDCWPAVYGSSDH